MVDKEFFVLFLSFYVYLMKELIGIEEEINFVIKVGKVDVVVSKEFKCIRRYIEGMEVKILE